MAAFELEHAIGREGKFCVHPNGQNTVYSSGGCVIIGNHEDTHDQVLLHGHQAVVTTLEVSHSGDMIASGDGGQDCGDVIIWQKQEDGQWKLKFRLEEHDYAISALCFSHDDRYLVSCGNSVDRQLIVWDASQGTIITHFPDLLNQIEIRGIACGGWVRTIKRRDTPEYQFATCGGKHFQIWQVDVHKNAVECVPVNSAGRQARLWQCLCFSDDYEYLYAGSSSGDIVSVLMKNRVMQSFTDWKCSGGVSSIAYQKIDGVPAIFAGGGDGSLTILTCQTPTDLHFTHSVKFHSGIQHLSFAPGALGWPPPGSAGTCLARWI